MISIVSNLVGAALGGLVYALVNAESVHNRLNKSQLQNSFNNQVWTLFAQSEILPKAFVKELSSIMKVTYI